MSGRARRSNGAQLALTAVLSLALTGCQSTMTTHPDEPRDMGTMQILPNEFPLRFNEHDFESHCYDTIGCSVLYCNRYQSKYGPEERASSPRGPDYRDSWGGAVHIGIPNFPPPAVVKWRSLDGVAHEAEVDFSEIFKDQKVLHTVPDEDIPEGWAHGVRPTIILEVNDRSINVFMKAHIATKQQQEPGNRYSTHRNDLILAWSQTF